MQTFHIILEHRKLLFGLDALRLKSIVPDPLGEAEVECHDVGLLLYELGLRRAGLHQTLEVLGPGLGDQKSVLQEAVVLLHALWV
jgi:hypothetical protein